MNQFPGFIVVAIAVATLLIIAIGFVVWQKLFAQPDFQSKGEFDSIRSSENVESTTVTSSEDASSEDGSAEDMLSSPESQRNATQTVSSGDTVTSDGIGLIEELDQPGISSQRTVENAGDISISDDDDQ